MDIQPYIPLDRVQEIGLARKVVECSLCHGLAWYPVACNNCDKAFCSLCIQALHEAESKQICPHGCSTYSERKNPPTIIRLLADLKITCRYQSNGCSKILSYNELEKHEQMCEYKLLICDGCQEEIIKKDFDEHTNECRLLLLTCDQCLTSYRREDKDLHTLTECLRIQLEQQKSKIEELEIKLDDQQIKIDQMEEKFKQNDILWNEFFSTINKTKDVSNKQV